MPEAWKAGTETWLAHTRLLGMVRPWTYAYMCFRQGIASFFFFFFFFFSCLFKIFTFLIHITTLHFIVVREITLDLWPGEEENKWLSCWFVTLEMPEVKFETGLCMEGEKRPQKDQTTQLGRWQFSQARELPHDACMGGHKMGRSSHLPASILKVYMELFRWFQQRILSEGCFSGGTFIPRTWEGIQLPGSRSWVSQWSCPLIYLLQLSE